MILVKKKNLEIFIGISMQVKCGRVAHCLSRGDKTFPTLLDFLPGTCCAQKRYNVKNTLRDYQY